MVKMVDLRAKVALILTTEFGGSAGIQSLFRPDKIVEASPGMHPEDVLPGAKIQWYAKNDRGEMVVCLGMNLQEFYEQYQKGNTTMDEKPQLSAFGGAARFIRKKFTVMPGGK